MTFDPNIRRQTEDLFFIHNTFGSYFSGVLDWFGEKFYPRFEYKVIGTYDKAVKFFKSRREMGIDPNGKLLPSVSLDPMLDFSNEERGGRFLWQFSRYAPGLGMRLFNSVNLKEQDVVITPVFSRYQGTFEMTFWLASVYELIDFRVALLQFCGGYNRWVRPEFFWSYLILPDQIENFEIEKDQKIDWSNSFAELVHVDTINKQRLALPIPLDPIWRLDSLGDSSTKYGGDQIAEYKLSGTFTYEVNIPTYVVLSKSLNPKIVLSFSLGKTYTKYPLISPYKILQTIAKTNSTQEYVHKDFKLFVFEEAEKAKENLVVEFTDNSVTFPENLSSLNYIVSGKLIHLTSDWLSDPQNIVHKDNIVFIESYKPEFLHSIRNCTAVISKNDIKASVLYSKCELLQKPLVSYITNTERETILSFLNKEVTLDSLGKKLYLGTYEVVVADEQDPIAGYDTLQKLKQNNLDLYNKAIETIQKYDMTANLPQEIMGPDDVSKMVKRILKDKCNGNQTKFYLSYKIDDKHLDAFQVYIDDLLMRQNIDYKIVNSDTIEFVTAPSRGASVYVGGEFLVVRQTKLIAIYEFTKDDLTAETKPVVQLPVKLDKQENLVLVSYLGRLEYEKHYTVNLINQTVTLLLDPIVGEIVQFFYFV